MKKENKEKKEKKRMSMKTKWVITLVLCIMAVITVVVVADDGCFDFRPGSVQANDSAVQESAAPVDKDTGKTGTASYTVLVTAGNGGSTDPSGSVSVTEWGSVTVNITPNDGYEIQSVSIDGSDKGALESYTLSNITENHSIVATFVKKPEPTPTPTPTPAAEPEE